MPNSQIGTKKSGNTGTSHYKRLCVVIVYLIDFMLVNVMVLGEDGANLPVCTEYAEFIHLKLVL